MNSLLKIYYPEIDFGSLLPCVVINSIFRVEMLQTLPAHSTEALTAATENVVD